ncbi:MULTISPECIES: glycosyltransferase family 2 protein [unclassified Haloferax]|uniref:glycosyltransferase family 2 protein n=1 Tax=unclassified Haloferax TaxID=2625095 RepID=UPI002875A48E|nr:MULTISPECIES: glycosyltransferase family 2 protein [unclassified Haloferax]MDS0243690.1 glycosyltransferase family 2 protein [Haloferax sp. S2CR25]MDS0446811.1 glycosyltransferase family 2 protein [Haloferax sp. S2CR25-2]
MSDSNPLVSYVVATYNRSSELERAIKSILKQRYENFEIIVISNSTSGPEEKFEKGGKFDEENIRYIHKPVRMGVINARNLGYQLADGAYVVTLDDDAILSDPHLIADIVDDFEQDDDLGIAALHVVNAKTFETEFPLPVSELEKRVPFFRAQMRPPDDHPEIPSNTTLFTGCGNIIRKELFENVGYYPELFDYGSEELDLCLRSIDFGYDIRYYPNHVVTHFEDPKGRFTDKKVLQENFTNRIALAIRNLPARLILLSLFVWTGQLLYRSQFDIQLLMSSVFELISDLPKLIRQRNPVDEKTIKLVNSMGGRAY